MATATYDMTTATFPAAISGSGLSASDITSSGNLAVFQQGLRSGNYVLQAANNSTTTADAARTNNRYATLTLTGTGQTITSIVVDAMKGGSTVRGFALATSDDSFATFLLQDDDINTVQPTLTTYSATGLSIALNGTVEVRIYPYSASNGQTSEFDNIVITTAASGGTTYNDTLTESVTGADSLATAATFANSLSESATAGESMASAATFASALTEALTAADTYTAGNVFSDTLAESLALSESIANAVTFAPTITETVAANDNLASAATFTSAFTEALTAADALAAAAAWTAVAAAAGSWSAQSAASGVWTAVAPKSGTWA